MFNPKWGKLNAYDINDGLDDNEVNREDVDFSDSEEIQEKEEIFFFSSYGLLRSLYHYIVIL